MITPTDNEFEHDGIITPTDNESWAVVGGTVKFSVSVLNWPFCSGENDQSTDMGKACMGKTGAGLELEIEIKGSSEVNGTLPAGEKRYMLATNAQRGNDITLELSDEVFVDGEEWRAMEQGYPALTYQGGKQVFTFRLPKFASSALYDPLVQGLETDVERHLVDSGMRVGVIIAIALGSFAGIAVLALVLATCYRRSVAVNQPAAPARKTVGMGGEDPSQAA